MNDAAAMRGQLTEIGDRFLRRTLGEVARLHALLDELRAGQPGALKEIEVLAHRIHGSGAMFGFEALSDAAEQCERIAETGAQDPEIADRIEASLAVVEMHLAAAARERGL